MHQTFYIDIDEEITSVIDRMRKSRLKRLIFVIPQRALVLQSVVNLKLLKRQADRMKKQIMIISQDEQTRTIAEKIGIAFQSSMQGIPEADEYKGQAQLPAKNRTDITAKGNVIMEIPKNNNRDIGSSGYFDPSSHLHQETEEVIREKPLIPQKGNIGTSGFEVAENNGIPPVIQPKIQAMNVEREMSIPRQPELSKKAPSSKFTPVENNYPPSLADRGRTLSSELTKEKEKYITSIFKPSSNPPLKKNEPQKSVSAPVGKGIKKTLIIFSLGCLLIAGGVAGYLFIPKAKVNIILQEQSHKFSFEAIAKTEQFSADPNEGLMPAKIIEEEMKETFDFQATGSTDGNDKKASGKVLIYNEFSGESQSLVATTRLTTSDGKLFRLTKSVTVPGMAKIGSEMKPGVVEVEVIADQSGEEFNIGPSQFKIPGFEGSPKYEKFYAKSENPMAGGGSSAGTKRKITSNDLAQAKTKSEKQAKDSSIEKITQKIDSGYQLVETTVETDNILITCPSEGQIGESFSCEAVFKVKAFAIATQDLEVLAIVDLKKNGILGVDSGLGSTKYNFVSSNPDFNSQAVALKIEGETILNKVFDEEKLKVDLAGKRKEEIADLLKFYPQIKNIEIVPGVLNFNDKLPTDPDSYTLNVAK